MAPLEKNMPNAEALGSCQLNWDKKLGRVELDSQTCLTSTNTLPGATFSNYPTLTLVKEAPAPEFQPSGYWYPVRLGWSPMC